jgi:hypothetical protein
VTSRAKVAGPRSAGRALGRLDLNSGPKKDGRPSDPFGCDSLQDGVSHGLQTGCQACHLLDQELNTCARCGSVDHDGPGVSCSSCDRQGQALQISSA